MSGAPEQKVIGFFSGIVSVKGQGWKDFSSFGEFGHLNVLSDENLEYTLRRVNRER